MKLGKYTALNTISDQSLFNQYIAALDLPIIDYVAIGVQDTIHNTSASLMSRPEWQKAFQELGLADHDPVRKTSFLTKAKMFSFDELDYHDSCGTEVMRQRKKFDLQNGLVLVDRQLGHNFMLTLATGYKNFSTHRFYIENHPAICKIFNDLKTLIAPSTKHYHDNIKNHPLDDAI